MLVLAAPAPPPLRVALAAPDALVRAALPAMLREAGIDVLDGGDGEPADVALWTSGVPDDATDLPALALADDETAVDAWRAGARGLLPRDADAADLVVALSAVARGLVVIDAALAEALLSSRLEAPMPDGLDVLTPREIETLALVAEGLPNKGVADRLGVAERTARYHVAQILAKLGAQSRTEAVVAGARLGLITL